MTEPNALRIGLAGLGTVGVGVARLLAANADLLTKRCGRELRITAVSARDHGRDRGIDLAAFAWCADPVALASRDDVDVVVELIGGSDGPAKELVAAALQNNKHVVTANKALIAHHGAELAVLAENNDLALNFEAAVAGGIPIIKALREGLAGNRFSRVYGILNGTCNYILSVMEESGRDFDDVLAEAQELGYAEADPAFDIDGVDAAHKLAILASVAYGCPVNFDAVFIDGIRDINALDIAFAKELGYRLKLLGLAELTPRGIEQRVHACLVPLATPIAKVDGVFNAVVVEGDFVDRAVFEGRGAGAGPTASAVVADIIDIARGIILPTFSIAADKLEQRPLAAMSEHVGERYVRLNVLDKPGVIADISAIFRDEAISIASLIQKGRSASAAVPVVLVLHECSQAAIERALNKIEQLPVVKEKPKMIRIEDL